MAGHHQWFTIKCLKSLSVSQRKISSGPQAEKIPAAHSPGDDPPASAFARRFSRENAETASAARGLRKIESSRDHDGLPGDRSQIRQTQRPPGRDRRLTAPSTFSKFPPPAFQPVRQNNPIYE